MQTQPRDWNFPAQPISTWKAQSRNKFLKQLYRPYLIIKFLLFWLSNKQTFNMFSLLGLYFVVCSRDVYVRKGS